MKKKKPLTLYFIRKYTKIVKAKASRRGDRSNSISTALTSKHLDTTRGFRLIYPATQVQLYTASARKVVARPAASTQRSERNGLAGRWPRPWYMPMAAAQVSGDLHKHISCAALLLLA